jgi:hypothetical protein
MVVLNLVRFHLGGRKVRQMETVMHLQLVPQLLVHRAILEFIVSMMDVVAVLIKSVNHFRLYRDKFTTLVFG